MLNYFTKELPTQVAVELVLWDIILTSEECDGSFKEKDKEKIKNLLSFFKQNLMTSVVNYKTYDILNKLIDILSDLLKKSDKEKSYKLLEVVREFDLAA